MGAVAIFKGKLVKFLAKAGLLIPSRAQTDRSAIPTEGEMAHNSTSSKIEVYQGSAWQELVTTVDSQTISGSKTFQSAINSTGLNIDANSSGSAVRITQTGAGNAIVVEDSTNPDSTPFIVDQNGKVLVGATASVGNEQVQISGTTLDTSSLRASRYSTDSSSGSIVIAKNRNATIGSHTAVVSGDQLGYIQMQGSDGTNHIPAANITVECDGSPATNSMPGRIVFATTASGSASPTEQMRIGSSGNIGIGTTNTTAPFATWRVVNINAAASGTAITNYSLNNSNIGRVLANSSQIGLENNTATGNLYLATNSTQRLVIDKDGLITINGTGTLQLPSGTNAERPLSPITGMLRHNSTTNNLESYNGTSNSWYNVTGGMFRNALINGSMAIYQRSVTRATTPQTFTAGGALAYAVDRWYGYCTGANVVGDQQSYNNANPSKYGYFFTGAAGVTAIGFGQRIESNNSAHFAGKTASLSATLANGLLSTVTWSAYYANTTDSFGTLAAPTRTLIATGTFSVTSTLTTYTATMTIPSAATTGIEIVFTVGAQTAGVFQITDVQFEVGGATPIERRSIGTELALCKDYCDVITGSSTAQAGIGFATSTTQFYPILFGRLPRRSITAVLNSTGWNARNGSAQIAITGLTVDTAVPGSSTIAATVASGLTAGNFYSLAAFSVGAWLLVSAEL